MLRFSIVIPNYNGGALLERAIQSVLHQDYPHVQLILADGESGDASRAVIDRYADCFDPLIRRRDGGQAEALNFAFRSASGDIHAWLCADDELLPGALSHVAAIFDSDASADVVAGASERVFESHFRNYVPVPDNPWDAITAQNLFDQPSVFWRAALHRRLGHLDTSYQLAFDWDFWCRMRLARARVRVTGRALSRYYFSGRNKSSVAGDRHVGEGFRIIRRYGPFRGTLAFVYRLVYRHFDLAGALDDPPCCSPRRSALWSCVRMVLDVVPGRRWMDLYNWHFASLQHRKLEWWDYKRPKLEELMANTGGGEIPSMQDDWMGGTKPSDEDRRLPDSMDDLNIVLNRRRLAVFLSEFAADSDSRDFLLLDALAPYAGVSISSTGLAEAAGGLALRPFRLWEYVWLFKVLELRRGNLRVLDLGGPISHITFLSALAGNDVLTIDVDSRAIQAAAASAATLGIQNLRAEIGDMRDLSGLPAASFDVILSCSVLEHLTAADQAVAMSQMARVLKPGGRIGLTFDYGLAAPSANIHLPPPHEPPPSAAEVSLRFVQDGLAIAGNPILEEPVPGSLFRSGQASYTIASLFLAKAPSPAMSRPHSSPAPSLLGALTVPDFPSAAYRSSSSRTLRTQREEAEKQTWVNQFNSLNERIARIEEAARERLAMLERAHRESQELRNEIDAIRAVAAERLDLLNEMTRALADRDAIRATAEERLALLTAAVADRDAIREEAEKRLALLNELTAAVAEREGRIAAFEAQLAVEQPNPRVGVSPESGQH